MHGEDHVIVPAGHLEHAVLDDQRLTVSSAKLRSTRLPVRSWVKFNTPSTWVWVTCTWPIDWATLMLTPVSWSPRYRSEAPRPNRAQNTSGNGRSRRSRKPLDSIETLAPSGDSCRGGWVHPRRSARTAVRSRMTRPRAAVVAGPAPGTARYLPSGVNSGCCRRAAVIPNIGSGDVAGSTVGRYTAKVRRLSKMSSSFESGRANQSGHVLQRRRQLDHLVLPGIDVEMVRFGRPRRPRAVGEVRSIRASPAHRQGLSTGSARVGAHAKSSTSVPACRHPARSRSRSAPRHPA